MMLARFPDMILFRHAGRRLLDEPLRGARAPGEPLDAMLAGGDRQRARVEPGFYIAAEFVERLRLREITFEYQLLLSETFADLPVHDSCQLRVVADLGVGVVRQVIGQQVDVIAYQAGHAPALDAGNRLRLAFPEIAVMHEDGIGAEFDGGVDQCLAGGDPANQVFDLGVRLDLQTIRTVVRKLLGIEVLIAEFAEFL